MNSTIIITGGAGFIGSNFIRHLLSEKPEYRIVNFDALTYAGNQESLSDILQGDKYRFVYGDICDQNFVQGLVAEEEPFAIVHFAAESHVDRSIDGPGVFVRTNVNGTFSLLEATRIWWMKQMPAVRERFRFLNISTDEVYGSLGETGLFTEKTPYAPNSPYSASKAASDHFVRAYFHTYGLPTLTTNCSNNYGPFQFPEKLIPLMILNAVNGKPLPIYGDGMQIRDWLYVEDHCRAIQNVLENGTPGATYNIGGNKEMTNIQIVHKLCAVLDELCPRFDGISYSKQITFVADRPGHDRRYAIDAGKIGHELGWQPQETFDSGIVKTVKWYLNNFLWCERITSGKYRQERLGIRS